MFEVVGWLFLRLFGFGWIWGRKNYITGYEAFGNGNPILFLLGIAVPIGVAVVGRLVFLYLR